MINIGYEIERLLKFAEKKEMISKWDVIPTRNALIDLLKVEAPFEGEVEECEQETPVSILNNILDYAVDTGLVEENTATFRDLFDAKVMGLLMPRQSEVVKSFYDKYERQSKELATDWFYDLSKSSNYIMTERIAKNLWWPATTEYGDLEITVNLSKPEKDPKEIAKAKLMKQASYPKCLLCKENVGYAGRLNHPARQNHRIIPIELTNKEWFLQYSPYVYYNEHCIVFSGEHEPMKLTRKSIERLVEFTEVLPHYFIGSNADLPIVGGSILTHDHYQGGRHEFPMEKAIVEKYYESSKYKNLQIGTVKWPMSVVRIKGNNKNEVIDAAMEIFEAWKNYSDEENEVLAFSGDTPHNTVTPIARRKGEAFELDIVLRNNRTSEEHPDGIFHPHKELHHIKKENIGLIEVMGLAVLPGRLEKELDTIAKILCGDLSYSREEAEKNDEISKHIPWIERMISENSLLTYDDAKALVKEEVGVIFSKVLEDAGVFKRTEKGQAGFEKFLSSVL
ncbi:UDP-glucose--hexose-1-phosphate uridylyltransferase [Clostridioides difficile]